MATINFPQSPNVGDIHKEAGNNWVYDGEKWSTNTSSPAWDRTAGFRNQLINPDFSIIQRLNGYNATQTVTLNTTQYFADRWAFHSAATGTCRINTSTTFPNFTMRQGADVSGLRQPIELPATGACGPFVIGSTWTASVWCNVDLTGPDFNGPALIFNSTAGGTTEQVVAASYVDWKSTGEIVNGFTRYYSTQTIDAPPAATSTCLEFILQKKTDGINTPFDWAQPQLEPGTVATPFELRPIGTENALCHRYFQRVELGNSNKSDFAMVTSGGSSESCTPHILYLSPMRNVGAAVNTTTDRTNMTAATGSNSFTGAGSNKTATTRIKGSDGNYILCCGCSDPPTNTTFSLRIGGSVTVSAEF